RSEVAGARVDEQMFLGVERHADRFTDSVLGSRLQRQRHRVERNLRRVFFELVLLCEGGLLFRRQPASASAGGRLSRLTGRGAALRIRDGAESDDKQNQSTFHQSLLLPGNRKYSGEYNASKP